MGSFHPGEVIIGGGNITEAGRERICRSQPQAGHYHLGELSAVDRESGLETAVRVAGCDRGSLGRGDTVVAYPLLVGYVGPVVGGQRSPGPQEGDQGRKHHYQGQRSPGAPERPFTLSPHLLPLFLTSQIRPARGRFSAVCRTQLHGRRLTASSLVREPPSGP